MASRKIHGSARRGDFLDKNEHGALDESLEDSIRGKLIHVPETLENEEDDVSVLDVSWHQTGLLDSSWRSGNWRGGRLEPMGSHRDDSFREGTLDRMNDGQDKLGRNGSGGIDSVRGNSGDIDFHTPQTFTKTYEEHRKKDSNHNVPDHLRPPFVSTGNVIGIRELDTMQDQKDGRAAKQNDRSGDKPIRRKVDDPLRKSSLVANDSSIDVSWFASRGLMSRRSFERYKKEMKNKVLSDAGHLDSKKSNSSGRIKKRGMIGGELRMSMPDMSGMKNEDFEFLDNVGSSRAPPLGSSNADNLRSFLQKENWSQQPLPQPDFQPQLLTPQQPKASVPKSKFPRPLRRKSIGDVSFDEKKNNNEVSRSTASNRKYPRPLRRRTLDDGNDNEGLDDLLKTFITSYKSGDREKNKSDASHIKSKLLVGSGSPGDSSGLNAQEIQVLTKMMKRLSEEVDKDNDAVPPSTNEDLPMSRVSSQVTLKMSGNNSADHKDASPPTAHQEEDSSLPMPSFDRGDSLSISISSLRQAKPLAPEDQDLMRSDDNLEPPTLERGETFATAMPIPERGQSSSSIESPNLFVSTPNCVESSIVGDVHSNSTMEMSRLDKGQSVSSEKAIVTTLDRSDTISTSYSKLRQDCRASIGSSIAVVGSCQKIEESLCFPRSSPQPNLRTESEMAVAGFSLPLINERAVKALVPSSCNSSGRNSPVDLDIDMIKSKELPKRGMIRRNSLSSFHSSDRLIERSFSGEFLADLDSIDGLEGPPPKEDCGDILAEGMEYLAMAMLVNIYGKLREMSVLGHASVKFIDIDVNSHQFLSRKKEMKRLGLLSPEEENKGYLENTKSAAFIVRAVTDEYDLMESASGLSMISEAKKADMLYEASLLSDFKTWVEESKVKQLDNITEELIKNLREECTKRKHPLLAEKLSHSSLSTMEREDLHDSPMKRRDLLSVRNPYFEGAALSKSDEMLIDNQFGLENEIPSSNKDCAAREHQKLSSKGSGIQKTNEDSSDYFEEGSIMRSLLEAGFEVVWFSDRHPSDIIYCIVVNRKSKTVTVVFRGQEGIFDTIRNSSSMACPNPIAIEDYPGHSESFQLRSSVAEEMLRIRRDTKKSTIEEICDRVQTIGKELTNGGKYHLSVAGHSLGGGMATVLGFYLAADSNLDLASAVRVFTFASSRVGCSKFSKAYQHLEESGRLMHARFSNSNDIVSYLPMWALDDDWKIDHRYMHVGMQIKLHASNRSGRARTQQALDVTYNQENNFLDELFQLSKNWLWAIKMINFGLSCCISEYQRRMHFAREYRLALGSGVLRFDKKRKNLKTLHEYYLMKCRMVEKFAHIAKQKEYLPSFVTFFVISSLLTFEIAIFMRFVSTW